MHRIMGSLNCSQPTAVIQPPAKTTLRSKYIRNMTGQVGLILQESVVYLLPTYQTIWCHISAHHKLRWYNLLFLSITLYYLFSNQKQYI